MRIHPGNGLFPPRQSGAPNFKKGLRLETIEKIERLRRTGLPKPLDLFARPLLSTRRFYPRHLVFNRITRILQTVFSLDFSRNFFRSRRKLRTTKQIC